MESENTNMIVMDAKSRELLKKIGVDIANKLESDPDQTTEALTKAITDHVKHKSKTTNAEN